MPGRINDFTDLSASNEDCSVGFDLHLIRPPSGEAGAAVATFHPDGTPQVEGGDEAANLGDAPVRSDEFSCGGKPARAEVRPAPGKTWDTVASKADLVVTLVAA
jgi:hypothetical protein